MEVRPRARAWPMQCEKYDPGWLERIDNFCTRSYYFKFFYNLYLWKVFNVWNANNFNASFASNAFNALPLILLQNINKPPFCRKIIHFLVTRVIPSIHSNTSRWINFLHWLHSFQILHTVQQTIQLQYTGTITGMITLCSIRRAVFCRTVNTDPIATRNETSTQTCISHSQPTVQPTSRKQEIPFQS